MHDNLLFASVDLPALDCSKAANEILSIHESFSFWDDYRYTQMIPLMTKKGTYARTSIGNNEAGDFSWVDCTPKIIIDWFEEVVFPWTKCKSRIMALITHPDVKNYEHIDCEEHEINTKQHKFRIVLQGQTDTLYFKTKHGDISAPNIKQPFIMDGGWPHGMYNRSNQIKVTLALGAPWRGNEDYNNINVLLKRDDYEMPETLDPYFQRKYDII